MKLVRDKIPGLFPGGTYVKVDNNEMLQILLRLKLAEEAGEALRSGARTELIEELADVLAVVEALAQASQIPLDLLWEAVHLKQATRGGFEEGWMLR